MVKFPNLFFNTNDILGAAGSTSEKNLKMLKPRKPLTKRSRVMIFVLNGHKWTKFQYPIDPLLELGLKVLFLLQKVAIPIHSFF